MNNSDLIERLSARNEHLAQLAASEIKSLRGRIERLRGLCKSASGWLLEAGDIEHSELVLDLAGDMEVRTLAETIEALRAVEGSDWNEMDDPTAEFMRIRR